MEWFAEKAYNTIEGLDKNVADLYKVLTTKAEIVKYKILFF